MTSKITWREEDQFAKNLLRKMQNSPREIQFFTKYTELDGRRFIDLNDYEED